MTVSVPPSPTRDSLDLPRSGLLRRALTDALAVVAPIGCAGCGADDTGLCEDCRSVLTAGVRTGPVETMLHGEGQDLRVWSALRYEGIVRRAILALKEEGRTDAARPLGHVLRAAVDAGLEADAGRRAGVPSPASAAVASASAFGSASGSGSGSVELVTVPPSRRAFRSRGYDPVALLVRRAGLPRPARVLRLVRESGVQKALDREGRSGNRQGSLRAPPPLHGRRLLLIDDVLTTGATMTEAARALRAAGADVMGAVTLAFTPLRSGEAGDRRGSDAVDDKYRDED